MVALGVAAALAVFLLYTSLAGGGTPQLQPGDLRGRTGTVQLTGRVVGPVRGDAYAGGLRFRLRDIAGPASVPVVYTGTVPDLFRAGRHILIEGQLRDGVFVAKPGSMITKCPSKYRPASQGAGS